jgi:dTDP-4-amino-4,6-dideoxygalactose transaminase
VPFARPDIGPDEIAAVVAALQSGWITSGPQGRTFEARVAEYLGGGVECVAVSSATAGLHLALEACGVEPGSEVIVPTHTFTATAAVVRYVGADPVFVDVDPETHCLDPRAVERAVTEGTSAIIPVHFAGRPAEMDSIRRIAESHNLDVIEDAAHAFSSVYRGAPIGTLPSAATVFSFHATKVLTTGEGGMLVTADKAIAARARVMRAHGIDRDAFSRSTGHSWRYEVRHLGFKYNMTDVAAAIGTSQLGRMKELRARRLELVERYASGLRHLPLKLPPPIESSSVHAWHLYVVELADDARLSRDEVVSRLRERQIECSVHYIPLHMQPYWRDRYGLRADDFPHSQRLAERSFSLPLHTRMTDADQARVIGALDAVLGGR